MNPYMGVVKKGVNVGIIHIKRRGWSEPRMRPGLPGSGVRTSDGLWRATYIGRGPRSGTQCSSSGSHRGVEISLISVDGDGDGCLQE